jgi:hypothetical protein
MTKGFSRAGKAATTALCGVLVPAGLALAGYQDGPYSGITEQTEPITFRAGEDRIRRLDSVVYADCENGTRQRIVVENGRTRLDAGRFSLDLSGAGDLVVMVTGKLRDNQAAGRIKATVRPAGTECAVETRWQASIKSPPAP